MSVLLAIDTAAPRLALAVLNGERIDTLIEDMATGQAERIFPALHELLARAGITYADLTRIVVTTGPGSFTGLRIGLSAARGLGLALNIPVLGIPSLLAISLRGRPGEDVSVVLDARRDEEYYQYFSAPGVPDGEPAIMQKGRWVCGGQHIIIDPFVDLAALARFAANANPADFPPEAAYIRDADAKPQQKFRIPRVPA
jgi:tRNA threonylcarbamoyladenosine biosynthesis protein TsaB